MGRRPAVVIVARHGARLDAADAQWHLTSPAPYDPPLTYGGWTQCRALGGRIGMLLKARADLFQQTLPEQQEQSNGASRHQGAHASGSAKPKKHRLKKHRVIIHSSPFLRCVQTSIAISAGISQAHGMDEETTSHPMMEGDQNVHEFGGARNGETKQDDNGTAETDEQHTSPTTYFKPRLRIDAFLGEWLSPDYYDSITPPPGSVLLVAMAKADLLHRGEFVETDEDPGKLASMKGNFPGGWGSSIAEHAEPASAEELSLNLSNIALKSTGGRDRSRTHDSIDRPSSSKSNVLESHSRANGVTYKGYVPPTPRYALSPSEPIPRGYVHHARDACIQVDYQWDSMRAPQNWGNGGEYGEEWSSMHRRFRKGLQSMIAWYTLHYESAGQMGGHARILHPNPSQDDDEDTDLVLVLVTHGAGCNALIGALTNQPVLLDVPMASLTMAVRKEDANGAGNSLPSPNSNPPSPRSPFSPTAQRSLNDHPLSAEYTVSLTASTDHLNASTTSTPFNSLPVTPLHSSSQPSTAVSSPRLGPRRRFDFGPSPLHDRAHSLSHLPPSSRFSAEPYPLTTSSLSSGVSATSSPSEIHMPNFAPDTTAPSNLRRSNTNSSMAERPSAGTAPQTPAQSAMASTGLWSRPSQDQQPRRTWSVASVESSASGAAGGKAASIAEEQLEQVASPTAVDGEVVSAGSAASVKGEGRAAAARAGSAAPVGRGTSASMKLGTNGKHTSSGGSAGERGGWPPYDDEATPSSIRASCGGREEIMARAGGGKRRWTVNENE